jgi:hypothetical protein
LARPFNVVVAPRSNTAFETSREHIDAKSAAFAEHLDLASDLHGQNVRSAKMWEILGVAVAKQTKTLFKGAGPGTHWHKNDARILGFASAARGLTRNAIVTHITAYSNPSAALSVSSSFAIARRYALSGPAGPATGAAPGYVYEIDLTGVAMPGKLVDPVQQISSSHTAAGAHQHNGDQTLLAEIASGNSSVNPFTNAMQLGGRMAAPAVSAELMALIFAIRDAEILVYGSIPHAAVVNRHDVW